MNIRSRAAMIILSATVVLGACGSDSKTSTTTKSTTATTAKPSTASTSTTAKPSTATTAKSSTATTATTAKSSTATTATTAKPSATTTTKPASTTSSAVATIGLGTTTLGKVLVDSEGRTLYLYKKDPKGGTTSTCDTACAAVWPPAATSAAPKAGSGVDAALLGTVTRADGTKQVTYNGMPLYRHSADTKAGDVTGEKVESEWYVVNAAGTAV